MSIIEKWLAYVSAHRAKLTYRSYRRAILQFAQIMPDIENVTINEIEQYIITIANKYSNSTANIHLSIIRCFYKWCSERYNVRDVARAVHLLPTSPPKQRVLSPEEYEKILAVCQTREEHDIVTILGNTGLRAREFLDLPKHSTTNDGEFLDVIGKRQKRRLIPLNSKAKIALARYKPRYTTRQGLHYVFECLAHRANIEPFGAHSFRHYFATELFMRGINPVFIGKILGHSSINTTLSVYVHFGTEGLAGLCDCLE